MLPKPSGFENGPIEIFERLLKEENQELERVNLLHMCYCIESYESVGGDEGWRKIRL